MQAATGCTALSCTKHKVLHTVCQHTLSSTPLPPKAQDHPLPACLCSRTHFLTLAFLLLLLLPRRHEQHQL